MTTDQIAVLIAEDDTDLREMWCACITGMNGFQAHVTATCRGAMAMIPHADILLLDLMLADGEAYQVFRQWVDEHGADTCAVISGNLTPEYRTRLILEGAAHVEDKPIQLHLLLTFMRRFERWIKLRRALKSYERDIEYLRAQVASLSYQIRKLKGDTSVLKR